MIFILFNPITLFMVLFLIFGINNLKKERYFSAAVYLLLVVLGVAMTTLLFKRAAAERDFSAQSSLNETDNNISNKSLEDTSQ